MLGFLGLTPALAADFGGSIKDDYVVPEAPFRWTGFYVGGQAGLATGQTQGKVDFGAPFTISTDYDMSGALYGAYVGYNYQIGQAVLGLEGTWSWADINGDTSCVVIFNCKRSIDSIATIVGRVGYAFNKTMVYGLGGVAWGDVDTDVVGNIFGLAQLRGGETHTGWVAGIGIEHALTSFLVARVEYNHIGFGSETHNLEPSFNGTVVGPSIPSKVDVDIDTIKVGAAIKFF
jgi:outer membrane immunogenic protein